MAVDRERVNWKFKVVCKDCGTEFSIEDDPNASMDILEKRHRMFILTLPNECPECHNIRVIPDADV